MPQKIELLQRSWERLLHTQSLRFSAKSKSSTGWNGFGAGRVEVQQVNAHRLHFHEKGSWLSEQNQQYAFSNIFRWTLQEDQGALMLEHLRFGIDAPVFLFALAPIDSRTLASTNPHQCNFVKKFNAKRSSGEPPISGNNEVIGVIVGYVQYFQAY